ncbi:hypothetical protein BCR34DRAFT_594410 [Clohesyomyces aquaticus]|uniref:Uncharacterized protein n=1 Tax=Clohesyomyces aquaticus TaxID=1231657 RepID=A0A1Y1Y905_9PLEO|nr:hypothetical protein BCR34DRAFT_594410 [Clohesyomyces aquaticus]
MSPTLAFQISFLLLGTTAVPHYIYDPAAPDPHNETVEAVAWVLRDRVKGLRVAVWTSEEKPRLKDTGKMAEDDGQHDEDEDQWQHWSSDSENVKPKEDDEQEKNIFHQERPNWKQRQRRRWKDLTSSGTWVLRLATQSNKGSGPWDISSWRQGDAQLTDDEASSLEDGIWCVPLVLQHTGAPVHNDVWRSELREILRALDLGFNQPMIGYPFKITVNERCRVVVRMAAPGEQQWQGWGLDEVKKVWAVLAAWEREIVATDSMAGVLGFWYLSRGLEWRGVKELRREEGRRRRALMRRRGKGAGDWWRKMWADGRMEDGEVKMPGDRKELWTVIHELDEEGLMRLLQDMRDLEQRGERLAVSFDVGRAHAGGSGGGDRTDECTTSTISSIENIIFQSHRSSLDPNELLAYLDFLACLLAFANETLYDDLLRMAISFRDRAVSVRESVSESLARFLGIIQARPETRQYYDHFLGSYEEDSPDGLVVKGSPFEAITRVVEKQRQREKEYMGTFIERYERAGGFFRVGREALSALLVDEDRRATWRA